CPLDSHPKDIGWIDVDGMIWNDVAALAGLSRCSRHIGGAMAKNLLAVSVLVAAVACGAGGGDSGSESNSVLVFLDAAPSEALLCSFIIGETTSSEVLDALGEPTHYSESSLGVSLQYWIGSEADVGGAGPRILVYGFDAAAKRETPYVQQLSFPACWRSQSAVMDE